MQLDLAYPLPVSDKLVICLQTVDNIANTGSAMFCCRIWGVEWVSLRPRPLRGGVREDQSVSPPLAATLAAKR
jgi:hypothetical protein